MRSHIVLRRDLLASSLLAAFLLPALLVSDRAALAAENTATKPVPRDENWMKRHEKFVEIAKRGGVDLLFVGDSITDAWGGEGHGGGAGGKIFEKQFVPLKAANFGIGGDRAQHVLWRLENGELDGIQPKVVMLMIGTNNSNGNDNTAEEIAEGIKAILKTIHEKSPHTKVLLLAIFPRSGKGGVKEDKVPAAELLAKTAEVNRIISKFDDGKMVRYRDIGAKFLEADGSLSKEIMPDFLHLSENGYQIWADAVTPALTEMLGK